MALVAFVYAETEDKKTAETAAADAPAEGEDMEIAEQYYNRFGAVSINIDYSVSLEMSINQ